MKQRVLKALKDNRITVVDMSKDLGITRQALYSKLSGNIPFTHKEIRLISKALKQPKIYVREFKKEYEVR